MYGAASSEAPSQEDSTSFMFSKPENNNTNSSSLNYRQYNMRSCTTDLNQSQPLARYRSVVPTSSFLLDTLLDGDGGGGFRKLLSSNGDDFDMEYDPTTVVKEESDQFSSSGTSFSDLLAVDNGFTKRLNDQIHFSSGKSSSSRYMPQIAENENGHLENCNSSNGLYVPSFENDSWNETSISGIKRSRGDEDKFSGFNAIDNQNKNNSSYPGRLTHHLSLPKTSGEVASMEKYLQFQQEAVPCKIRAKRGFATHPRSIAERMRRMRISDRIKKLQDLFPDMDKQTNTADMLDLAVEYIKNLQNQVEAKKQSAHVSNNGETPILETNSIACSSSEVSPDIEWKRLQKSRFRYFQSIKNGVVGLKIQSWGSPDLN